LPEPTHRRGGRLEMHLREQHAPHTATAAAPSSKNILEIVNWYSVSDLKTIHIPKSS